jgi:hypothetical protein
VNQAKRYRNSPRKTNLKVVPAGGSKITELRLGGLAPTEDMKPGVYLAKCESAWIEPVGKAARVVVQYSLIDGKHDGVALRQWLPASDGGGVVSPTGRYARQCAIALGRSLSEDDSVNDPAAICF